MSRCLFICCHNTRQVDKEEGRGLEDLGLIPSVVLKYHREVLNGNMTVSTRSSRYGFLYSLV